MENFNEKIKECKSFSEVARLFGYDYYNARIKKIVIEQCFCYKIDIVKQINDYNNRKVYCLNCGREIIGKDRFRKKFCCSSCATSYNNKKRLPKSDKEKRKISLALKKYHLRNVDSKSEDKFKTISECIKEGLILNPYSVYYMDMVIGNKKYSEKECIVCGMKFKPFLNKNGNLFKGNTCSEKCFHELRKENSKKTYKRLVNEGRFKGWQSRNVLSYPELFWIKVLNNNNIEFIPNKPLKHGNSNYFLDFYIERENRKIDLEIDGRQHELKERVESDRIRDKFVSECGIEVYRIKWNEINTEKGKQIMKEKIENFLKFLNNNVKQ